MAHRGQQSRNRLHASSLSRAGSTVGRRDLIAINVPPWSFRSRGRGHHHLPVADPIGQLRPSNPSSPTMTCGQAQYCCPGKRVHNKSHILGPAPRSMATGPRDTPENSPGSANTSRPTILSSFILVYTCRNAHRPMYIFYRKSFRLVMVYLLQRSDTSVWRFNTIRDTL